MRPSQSTYRHFCRQQIASSTWVCFSSISNFWGLPKEELQDRSNSFAPACTSSWGTSATWWSYVGASCSAHHLLGIQWHPTKASESSTQLAGWQREFGFETALNGATATVLVWVLCCKYFSNFPVHWNFRAYMGDAECCQSNARHWDCTLAGDTCHNTGFFVCSSSMNEWTMLSVYHEVLIIGSTIPESLVAFWRRMRQVSVTFLNQQWLAEGDFFLWEQMIVSWLGCHREYWYCWMSCIDCQSKFWRSGETFQYIVWKISSGNLCPRQMVFCDILECFMEIPALKRAFNSMPSIGYGMGNYAFADQLAKRFWTIPNVVCTIRYLTSNFPT